jgi:hypothetical protein
MNNKGLLDVPVSSTDSVAIAGLHRKTLTEKHNIPIDMNTPLNVDENGLIMLRVSSEKAHFVSSPTSIINTSALDAEPFGWKIGLKQGSLAYQTKLK